MTANGAVNRANTIELEPREAVRCSAVLGAWLPVFRQIEKRVRAHEGQIPWKALPQLIVLLYLSLPTLSCRITSVPGGVQMMIEVGDRDMEVIERSIWRLLEGRDHRSKLSLSFAQVEEDDVSVHIARKRLTDGAQRRPRHRSRLPTER